MTWRELWKSTVTNLRALLGFAPPPPPPPAPIVRRKPLALTGPVKVDRPDPAPLSPPMLDLTPTRATPPPSAPLRRKPSTVTSNMAVDVALDAAAFAANRARKEPTTAPPHPLAPNPTISNVVNANPVPTPALTWTRQGVAQTEAPEMGAPLDKCNFAGEDATGSNGYAAHEAGHGDEFAGDDGDDGGDDNFTGDDEGVALTTLLESLLFVASEPVEPRQLAQTLAQPIEVIELGLAELADYYQRSLRGVRVQRYNGKVQLVTAPVAAPFIEVFLNLDNTTRLSTPALETLAVIAYRQPVTRAQIEAVRGVDCAGVLRSLAQRGLVTEVGRMEGIGRPILYGVTELFMQHFGLMEMGELPPLEETEADRLWAATVIDEPEPPH